MGAANKLGPLRQDFGRSSGKRHLPARGKIVDDPFIALVESLAAMHRRAVVPDDQVVGPQRVAPMAVSIADEGPQPAKQVGRVFPRLDVDPEGRPVSFARGTFSGLRVELIIEP